MIYLSTKWNKYLLVVNQLFSLLDIIDSNKRFINS